MEGVGSDIYRASPYPARDSGAGRVVVPACPLQSQTRSRPAVEIVDRSDRPVAADRHIKHRIIGAVPCREAFGTHSLTENSVVSEGFPLYPIRCRCMAVRYTGDLSLFSLL